MQLLHVHVYVAAVISDIPAPQSVSPYQPQSQRGMPPHETLSGDQVAAASASFALSGEEIRRERLSNAGR